MYHNKGYYYIIHKSIIITVVAPKEVELFEEIERIVPFLRSVDSKVDLHSDFLLLE
jgi:hypothetical protein